MTLPVAYAAEHLDLGYAVTAHRAQGVTADTCHVLVTPTTTRENLYVAMTRGRSRNQAYVAVDRPDPAHDAPHPSDNPDATAQTVLAGVLANTGAELSAHQMAQAEAEQWGNTAQLRAEVETLIAAAQHDRWTALVQACGLTDGHAAQALDSEAFGPLCAQLRRAETCGIQPEDALPKLVAARSVDTAADVASVLHDRLARHVDNTIASRYVRATPRYTLGLMPHISTSRNRRWPTPSTSAWMRCTPGRPTSSTRRSATTSRGSRTSGAGPPTPLPGGRGNRRHWPWPHTATPGTSRPTRRSATRPTLSNAPTPPASRDSSPALESARTRPRPGRRRQCRPCSRATTPTIRSAQPARNGRGESPPP
ncbi:MAG: hypothetical protein FWF75_06205 [Propionibacteriaceae bacterium]|nr:hypothetical protein [Propionibacteriaceae bacterium]